MLLLCRTCHTQESAQEIFGTNWVFKYSTATGSDFLFFSTTCSVSSGILPDFGFLRLFSGDSGVLCRLWIVGFCFFVVLPSWLLCRKIQEQQENQWHTKQNVGKPMKIRGTSINKYCIKNKLYNWKTELGREDSQQFIKGMGCWNLESYLQTWPFFLQQHKNNQLIQVVN